jgi:acyl-CoA synthetase (AMP-forming)/AMP-acid ligase II/acyl carrier protein
MQAGVCGQAPALVVAGRQSMTYTVLRSVVERTVTTLASAGLGRGSRVGVSLPNGPETAVLILSALTGAIWVPLNPELGATEYRFLLGRLRVDALITPEGAETPAVAIARSLGLALLRVAPRVDDLAGAFDLRVETARPAIPQTTPLPEDIGVVFHTSGTTSLPKVVPLLQSQVMARSYRQPIDRADRCLFVNPMFTSGALPTLLTPLACGASIGFAQTSGADALLEALQTLEPTYFSTNPTLLSSLLDRLDCAPPLRPTTLRFIRTAGIALTPALQARLEAGLGVPILQGYGLTEAGPIAQNPLPPGCRKPASVGLSVGPEIAIVDEYGNRLGPNEDGEIVVNDAGVMAGYEDDPDANREAFRGRWFRTGDIGHLDEGDYLFLTGRLKEIVNRGSMKVSLAEVDDALMRHSDVADAAAFGVPHPTLGEDLMAAVVVRGQRTVSMQQLREFAFEHLAAYKVPTAMVSVGTLPRSALGKINRIALAKSLRDSLFRDYVAPRNDREAIVAATIADVLKLERVGVDDNFFALGGDSMRAMQVIVRINSVLGSNLGADALFRWPILADFAAAVASGRGSRPVPPPIVPRRAGIGAASETPGTKP